MDRTAFKAGLAVALLGLLALLNQAHAEIVTSPGWVSVPRSWAAFVVARSATRTLPPSYSGNYNTAVTSANAAYRAAQSRMDTNFVSEAKAMAESRGFSVSASRLRLTGPINIAFTWNGAGHDVEIGGFGFKGYTSVSGTYWGVSGTCAVDVNASALSFRGKFDWANGRVVDLKAGDVSISRGISCETSLSWIPIVGQIADALAERFAAKKFDGLGSVQEFVESRMASDGVFDMSKLIPAGSLVNPDNGSDIGGVLYTRNALFPGNDVRLVLNNPDERPEFYYNWFDFYGGGPRQPLPKAQYPVFTVDVVGRLKYGLALFEEVGYKGEWRCPRTQPSCIPPL